MLAAVLAHEMAHVTQRHSVENLGVGPTLGFPSDWQVTRCACLTSRSSSTLQLSRLTSYEAFPSP
jgi:hypothetical protein